MNRADLPGQAAEPLRSDQLEVACQTLRELKVLPPRASLQEALRQVALASDLQILGICAGSLAEGRQVLVAYATALGLPQPNPEFADLVGAVYIKFNPGRQCYASSYSGSERGVLVSCQSAEESDLNEMFGPLPLDLFSEPP